MIIHGYSEEELKNLPDNSVDLIFKRVEEKRKEKDLTQKTLFGDEM
jgi:hypothetical protein